MTAGQRNCFIAIGECLDRYDIDDVLAGLVGQLQERASGLANPIEQEHYKRLARLVASSNTDLREVRQRELKRQQATQ